MAVFRPEQCRGAERIPPAGEPAVLSRIVDDGLGSKPESNRQSAPEVWERLLCVEKEMQLGSRCAIHHAVSFIQGNVFVIVAGLMCACHLPARAAGPPTVDELLGYKIRVHSRLPRTTSRPTR